jgi:NADPH2:quinone reductase
VRGALIRELGQPPALAELPEPEQDDERALVEVAAVPLNPVDISIGAGRFYGGRPELPFVPGTEAVGRILAAPSLGEGIRVYFGGDGLGLTRDGTLAERVRVAEQNAVPLPGGVDDLLAAAAGTAGIAGWMPVAWRSPVQEGDRVLVLGATGTVGSVAAQGAKLLGAERVVGAGRDHERLARIRELGVDATIELGNGDLVEQIVSAFDGDGPTLIVDPLWGAPAEAAAKAAARGARMVSLGQAAGPNATFASADVRGKTLTILGYSNFTLTPEIKRAGYLQLLDHVASGRITIDLEAFPLERVADAWRNQAAGRKTVVTL